MGRFRLRRALVQQGDDRILSRCYGAKGSVHGAALHASADEYRCDGVDLFLLQTFEICFGQQVPCLYFVTRFDMAGKKLSF